MASVLSLEELAYAYSATADPVFRNVNLDVTAGEFVAIVGKSGVGKSTLLRCVAGLAQPTAGTVDLRVERDGASRPCGFVFQDTRLLPWRRVRGNVAYGLEGLKLPRAEADARIQEALRLAMVDELAARWPHQLSGGQAQRVGIARALAVHPHLLLMDEPFSAVDALTRQKLQDELLAIWQRTRPAVLFVTHDIEEAAYLADRVVVLGGSPARVTSTQVIPLSRPREREDARLQDAVGAIHAAL